MRSLPKKSFLLATLVIPKSKEVPATSNSSHRTKTPRPSRTSPPPRKRPLPLPPLRRAVVREVPELGLTKAQALYLSCAEQPERSLARTLEPGPGLSLALPDAPADAADSVSCRIRAEGPLVGLQASGENCAPRKIGTSLCNSAPQLCAATAKTLRRCSPRVVPGLPPTGATAVVSLSPTPGPSRLLIRISVAGNGVITIPAAASSKPTESTGKIIFMPSSLGGLQLHLPPLSERRGENEAGLPAGHVGLPVAFDTDVDGAALGEGHWGAAAGLSTFVYITVGTGIGAGAVVNGAVAHGLVHAEMGHVIVDRQPGDDYPGRCPFHGDCMEGMAAGPTIEDRFGVRAEHLEGDDVAQAVEWEAGYLASGIRNMVYILAPERVVIGGGVAELPGLFPALRRNLAASLAGYPGLPEHESDNFVVPAALGGMAGPLGSLVLAEQAAPSDG